MEEERATLLQEKEELSKSLEEARKQGESCSY
jgi:hypothetical protein